MASSNVRRENLLLDAGKSERIPAVLQVPAATSPVAAVLLLHGFSSRKERVADSVGVALAKRDVASLAIDFPLHGEREGHHTDIPRTNPIAVAGLWRLVQHEARSAFEYLAKQAGVDAARIGVAGYSMGAFVGVFLAADEPRVKALALVAGGDLPAGMPMESLVRRAVNPQRAIRKLEGRPLLMVNGKGDRTIRPSQATALFEAADEPKELRWYSGGHWPPQQSIDDVADWLALKLGRANTTSRKSPRIA